MNSEELSRIEARADSLVDAHEELMRGLVELRKFHKLSQETVAERMSVSQPTVAAFERYDSNPTLATIRRYALAVGAKIQNSVIDDCVEHARTFELLVEPMSVLARTQPLVKSFWHAPKTRVTASV